MFWDLALQSCGWTHRSNYTVTNRIFSPWPSTVTEKLKLGLKWDYIYTYIYILVPHILQSGLLMLISGSHCPSFIMFWIIRFSFNELTVILKLIETVIFRVGNALQYRCVWSRKGMKERNYITLSLYSHNQHLASKILSDPVLIVYQWTWNLLVQQKESHTHAHTVLMLSGVSSSITDCGFCRFGVRLTAWSICDWLKIRQLNRMYTRKMSFQDVAAEKSRWFVTPSTNGIVFSIGRCYNRFSTKIGLDFSVYSILLCTNCAKTAKWSTMSPYGLSNETAPTDFHNSVWSD